MCNFIKHIPGSRTWFHQLSKAIITGPGRRYQVPCSEKAMSRCLLAFDFDHTLIDDNSDLYVIKLAPNGTLPTEVQNLYSDNGWTEYMGEIFKYLHSTGVKEEDIMECISEIPLTTGMKELLEFTSSANNFDHIIISDSNSVFIDCVLQACGLSNTFHTVFTNPAKFDTDGCLTLKGYHSQDWCSLSTQNMCKGHILSSFIEERKKSCGINYKSVLYVGDGYNDLCPSLTLRQEDFVLPRQGFKLNKLIMQIKESNKPVSSDSLKGHILPWVSGIDILKAIQDLANQEC